MVTTKKTISIIGAEDLPSGVIEEAVCRMWRKPESSQMVYVTPSEIRVFKFDCNVDYSDKSSVVINCIITEKEESSKFRSSHGG